MSQFQGNIYIRYMSIVLFIKRLLCYFVAYYNFLGLVLFVMKK